MMLKLPVCNLKRPTVTVDRLSYQLWIRLPWDDASPSFAVKICKDLSVMMTLNCFLGWKWWLYILLNSQIINTGALVYLPARPANPKRRFLTTLDESLKTKLSFIQNSFFSPLNILLLGVLKELINAFITRHERQFWAVSSEEASCSLGESIVIFTILMR